MTSFHRWKTKVWIVTEEPLTTPHNTTPLYVEEVHMLDRLGNEEGGNFLEDHSTIIPLFEIDAISAVGTSPDEDITDDSLPHDEPDATTIAELRHARDTSE